MQNLNFPKVVGLFSKKMSHLIGGMYILRQEFSI